MINIQNVKRTLNLFMREETRVSKLQANVNDRKKLKSQLNFSLIAKKKRSIKKLDVNGKEICDQTKVNNEIRFF